MLKEMYLPRFWNKKAYHSLLLLLICFAVALRAVYFNGFIGSDDADYNYASFMLAQGDLSLDSHHSKRLGLILPTALAFKVFGLGEISSVLFSLICSLTNIIIAFAAGKIFFNRNVGLLASLLILFLPIDVIHATRLFPDLPLVTFVSISVILFIYTETNTPRHRHSLSFLTGFCMGCAYLIKETAILVLLLLCIWILTLTIKNKRFSTSWLFIGFGFIVVLLLEFGFFYYKTGNPFERILTANNATYGIIRWLDATYNGALYKRLTYAIPYLLLRGDDLFGFYFYLVLGGIIYALLGKSKELRYFILWFISLYLIFNFGSTNLKSYIPLFASNRHFYPLIFPGIIIISYYLYDSYTAIIAHNIIKVKNFCISLIAIVFILLCLNLFEYTITNILFGSLLSISILYCIYIITHHEKEIDKIRFVIPALLGSIFLHSLCVVHVETHYIKKLTYNERETVSLLGTPLQKKVYTDCMTEGTLEYLYAYHNNNLIVNFVGRNIQEISDCYVIINMEIATHLNKLYGTEIPDFIKNPPDTWKIIKKFITPNGGSCIIMQVD